VQERLVALGEAHAQRLALQWFDEAVRKCEDQGTRAQLDKLGALHALTIIDRAAAFYLEEGYLDPGKSRAMRDQTSVLLAELAPVAVDLVNAFGIPDACLAAPIAFMDPANPRWE
jgi:acyl-CoA oxidase